MNENKTTALPAVVPVEPQITKNEMAFEWNFKEIKEYLKAATEKYKGLVVNGDNVKDFSVAHSEVVHLRTALTRFSARAKRELKKPQDEFSAQVKELLGVVEEVETPMTEQLDVYEQKRLDELKESIIKEYTFKATAACVRDEFKTLDFNPTWENKTAKWSQICKDIDQQVKQQLADQEAADRAADMAKAKRELVLSCIQTANLKYGLKTPISDDFADGYLLDLDTDGMKGCIEAEAQKRKAIEDAAEQAAIAKAEEAARKAVQEEARKAEEARRVEEERKAAEESARAAEAAEKERQEAQKAFDKAWEDEHKEDKPEDAPFQYREFESDSPEPNVPPEEPEEELGEEYPPEFVPDAPRSAAIVAVFYPENDEQGETLNDLLDRIQEAGIRMEVRPDLMGGNENGRDEAVGY
jgi:predicted ribosome quality control (RQC) complex YloA/Tae2 family protein